MHAYDGGAIWLSDGSLIIDSEASLTFSHYSAGINGGAILLQNGKLIATANANMNFSNNSAIYGGAFLLRNSIAQVDTDGILFYKNRGSNGGALCFNPGIMYINANKSVKVIMNVAQDKGGTIFIETGVHPSIVVDNSSRLLLFNISAIQGGALYIMPSSFMITVGYQSSIQFINNVAFDVGGAVYSLSASPCTFMITDYSAQAVVILD